MSNDCFVGSMKLLRYWQTRTHCCGQKMFLNKIRNIFVYRTQNLYPQQMLRAQANREKFVSATMCPRLPVPLVGPTNPAPYFYRYKLV